ncbi:DNA-binding transcriptional regulator IscR [Enterobacter cloacae]|uniref:DNA-binding transcriptional regulator IscR n=1 Tax=Enterobacter cloacae TaxID=550 RepID=A0A377LV61_ENTCL|nr:DNA-binding transcriptional regulator IscR [Enterobacter cloacae]
MRLTSKGRYAVTAMLDVALNSEAGPVPLADISERQGISLSYLEQLFSRLRKNGLVSSVRGPGGGYLLGKDAAVLRLAKSLVRLTNPLTRPVARGKVAARAAISA